MWYRALLPVELWRRNSLTLFGDAFYEKVTSILLLLRSKMLMLNLWDKLKKFLGSGTFSIVCYILCAVLQIASSIKYQNAFNLFLAVGFLIFAVVKARNDTHWIWHNYQWDDWCHHGAVVREHIGRFMVRLRFYLLDAGGDAQCCKRTHLHAHGQRHRRRHCLHRNAGQQDLPVTCGQSTRIQAARQTKNGQ